MGAASGISSDMCLPFAGALVRALNVTRTLTTLTSAGAAEHETPTSSSSSKLAHTICSRSTAICALLLRLLLRLLLARLLLASLRWPLHIRYYMSVQNLSSATDSGFTKPSKKEREKELRNTTMQNIYIYIYTVCCHNHTLRKSLPLSCSRDLPCCAVITS